VPHVIVAAHAADGRERLVMLRERINATDFESDHFAARLVERLAWAVSDAHGAEQALQRTSGRDAG